MAHQRSSLSSSFTFSHIYPGPGSVISSKNCAILNISVSNFVNLYSAAFPEQFKNSFSSRTHHAEIYSVDSFEKRSQPIPSDAYQWSSAFSRTWILAESDITQRHCLTVGVQWLLVWQDETRTQSVHSYSCSRSQCRISGCFFYNIADKQYCVR